VPRVGTPALENSSRNAVARRGGPRLAAVGLAARMSPFHKVEELYDGRIVRIVRSPRAFQSVLELHHERLLLVEALNRLGRAGRGLLVDSREAPHSTDDRMQEEFRRFRLDVSRGFDAVAIVVRTKVGMLQVRRLGTQPSSEARAFDEEHAAIEFLLQQVPVAPAVPPIPPAR